VPLADVSGPLDDGAGAVDVAGAEVLESDGLLLVLPVDLVLLLQPATAITAVNPTTVRYRAFTRVLLRITVGRVRPNPGPDWFRPMAKLA
jgi:hypothetical protein